MPAKKTLIGMIDDILKDPYSRKLTHGFTL